MATAVQQLPLKSIIIHRSCSLPGTHTSDPSRSSSLSSSPTSSTGPSACGASSEAPTVASRDTQRNSTSPAQGVMFAPLPVIEPRRKKSNVQLGVAARSRMLQQRKAWREETARRQAAPMWTDLDESAVRAAEKAAETEDPVVVMGRYLAERSKHLWRRVSKKEKGPARRDGDREGEKGDEAAGSQECRSPSPPPESVEDHERESQEDERGNLENGEGGMWEEEIVPGFQSNVAQRTPKEDSGKTWTRRTSVAGSP